MARVPQLRLRLGKGVPLLPDYEPVVKTRLNWGGLLHLKTPAMSRLGTIDWPSLEDLILVTPVTDLSPGGYLVGLHTDVRTNRIIRLVRRPGSLRPSNVQTFYGSRPYIDSTSIRHKSESGVRASIIHKALQLYSSH